MPRGSSADGNKEDRPGPSEDLERCASLDVDEQPLLRDGGTPLPQAAAGDRGGQPLPDTSLGLWLMLTAGALAATLGLSVNVATRMGIPSLLVVLVRSLTQLLAALAVSGSLRISPVGPKAQIPWMASWGALASVATTIYYYALSVIDLGNATTLWFTMPIWITLLAHFFLGEPVTCTVAAASLSSLVGVAMVAQPAVIFGRSAGAPTPEALDAGLGALCALLGAFLMACAQVIVRGTSCKTHWVNSVFWMGAVSTAIALPGVCLQGAQPPSEPMQWALLVAIGIIAVLLDCCLVVGLRLAQAGPGAVMRNFDVVLSYIYQINLLHSPASTLSIAGASIITLSAVAIGLDKWQGRRKLLGRA